MPDKTFFLAAFDERVSYATLLSIFSLRTQHPGLSAFWRLGIIEGEVSPRISSKVTGILASLDVSHSLEIFPDDELFTERRGLTKTTFCKFRLTDKYKNPAIWLDSDSIVVSPIDALIEKVLQPQDGVSLVVAEYSDSYFNAGVMGFTSNERPAWRTALAEQPSIRWSSEEKVFNQIYSGSIEWVSREFNYLWQWLYEMKAEESPKIIHFVGPYKPWHLPLSQVPICLEADCAWSHWFKLEGEFLKSLTPDDRAFALDLRKLGVMRKHPSSVYRWFQIVQHLGKCPKWIVRLINTIMLPLRKFVPAAAHPFHGHRVNANS